MSARSQVGVAALTMMFGLQGHKCLDRLDLGDGSPVAILWRSYCDVRIVATALELASGGHGALTVNQQTANVAQLILSKQSTEQFASTD